MRIVNGAGPPGVGILQAVLLRWQRGKTPISVFGLPAVQAVIDYKWETWAKHALLVEFVVFLCWLLSFTIFVYSFRVRFLTPASLYIPVYVLWSSLLLFVKEILVNSRKQRLLQGLHLYQCKLT